MLLFHQFFMLIKEMGEFFFSLILYSSFLIPLPRATFEHFGGRALQRPIQSPPDILYVFDKELVKYKTLSTMKISTFHRFIGCKLHYS